MVVHPVAEYHACSHTLEVAERILAEDIDSSALHMQMLQPLVVARLVPERPAQLSVC